MKCALVIAEGIKQVMFTPENDQEKAALKLLGEDNSDIMVERKRGTFFDNMPPSASGYTVGVCRGGYLRAYESAEALMLVVRPKPKDAEPKQEPGE